tara:strand:- start:4431 stop:6389 length:1959 start_codon:yes stop_codon:yes gene_type:complete
MQIPVLLPNIFDHAFTYETEKKAEVGQYVEVPFGKTDAIGIVWDQFEKVKNSKKFKIKKIKKFLNIPKLNTNTINFLNWFSEYNLVPKGMALKLHLLSNEAIESLEEKEYLKFNEKLQTNNYELNKEQNDAFKDLVKKDEIFRTHVLQGTTGSGKTIVYFNAIKKKINKGFQVLILLPEIGLTNEFEKKFIDFFGFKPAIWHSSITKKKKKIIWSGLSSNKIKVVIGARSALFLPFKNLGLITVDEEHDQSYKQDEGVIYNARDMAISRAMFEKIPINLVSSVPSVETYNNIKLKKYEYSRILKRHNNANLPEHEIIDLKKYSLEKQKWISSKTLEKVKVHLDKGDQILFFLNRRGYSPFVLCKKCINVFSCPNCSINLVFHKKNNQLLCHYCGYKTGLHRDCIDGKKCELAFSGPGVEKIHEEVKSIFSNYKSVIFSSDTMNKKSSIKTLNDIIENKINILIGTQMISKGFHFPNLNCIVVLDIDLTSQGHDLRAAEKNLQLYHQLSGRAGRTGKPAKIYFQTYNIRSDVISQLTDEDPFLFLEKELILRKNYSLPPFERFIGIIITSSDQDKLKKESFILQEKLNKNLNCKVLGPVDAPILKIKKNYRSRILIRAKKDLNIQKKLSEVLKSYNYPTGIKLIVDVDPISFN